MQVLKPDFLDKCLLLVVNIIIIILAKSRTPTVQKDLHKMDKYVNKIPAKKLQIIETD